MLLDSVSFFYASQWPDREGCLLTLTHIIIVGSLKTRKVTVAVRVRQYCLLMLFTEGLKSDHGRE